MIGVIVAMLLLITPFEAGIRDADATLTEATEAACKALGLHLYDGTTLPLRERRYVPSGGSKEGVAHASVPLCAPLPEGLDPL